MEKCMYNYSIEDKKSFMKELNLFKLMNFLVFKKVSGLEEKKGGKKKKPEQSFRYYRKEKK